jgi:hypothetical protein
MKKTRKVTRVKLQVDQINDFILFGLVSSEPDYKLSLALNKKFSISLKNISPVKISGAGETELLFSRFSDSSESPDRIFNLISNRSGKHFLIRKLRNVDYILHVHDPDNKNIVSRITSSLREIDTITAVFNIDTDSMKDKNLHLVIQ